MADKPPPINPPFPAPATGFRDYLVDAAVAWQRHDHNATNYDHDFDEAHARIVAGKLIDRAIYASTHPDTCDASVRRPLDRNLGPCILRHQHDGPVHKDATGATWTSTRHSLQPIIELAENWRHMPFRADAYRELAAILNRPHLGEPGPEPSWECPNCGGLVPASQQDLRLLDEAESTVDRVRRLAADMRDWCSPHGVATHYAKCIDDALDGKSYNRPA